VHCLDVVLQYRKRACSADCAACNVAGRWHGCSDQQMQSAIGQCPLQVSEMHTAAGRNGQAVRFEKKKSVRRASMFTLQKHVCGADGRRQSPYSRRTYGNRKIQSTAKHSRRSIGATDMFLQCTIRTFAQRPCEKRSSLVNMARATQILCITMHFLSHNMITASFYIRLTTKKKNIYGVGYTVIVVEHRRIFRDTAVGRRGRRPAGIVASFFCVLCSQSRLQFGCNNRRWTATRPSVHPAVIVHVVLLQRCAPWHHDKKKKKRWNTIGTFFFFF
jgi:hypothetical protein